MARIYLDYAATSPVDPEVLRAMQPYFKEKFGNPGSLHSFGQEAMAAVDFSRETIAEAINAKFREIIFTGSATEANNLALRGILKGYGFQVSGFRGNDGRKRDLTPSTYNLKPRIIVSAIEHESVLETARDLEREGVEVVYLSVSREGLVDLEKLKSSLNENTVLVSVGYVNNEVGTIQPIPEISAIIRNFREKSDFQFPLLHTDAAQAFQFLDCAVQELGVDLMTLSAHKIYGPKGIGALYVRQNLELSHKDLGITGTALSSNGYFLSPIITGGGQEFGLRSGTESVPLIVGFAKAVELAVQRRAEVSRQATDLKDYFWAGLKKFYPKAELNGPDASHADRRASHILNIYFPAYEAEELLTRLDLSGIAASAGSACKSRSVEPSYVIEALGHGKERAKRGIRFSFGKPTGKKEIDTALGIIKKLLVH